MFRGEHSQLVKTVALGVVCFGAACLDLSFHKSGTVLLLWLPSGLAIAGLFLLGLRAWPAVALATCAAGLGTGPADQTAAASLLLSLGCTIEALAGAALLRNVFRIDPRLGRVGDVLRLVVLGALLPTLLGSGVHVTTAVWAGFLPQDRCAAEWLQWWRAAAAGVVVAAPLVLTCARAPRFRLGRARLVELSLLAAVVTGVCSLAFTGRFTFSSQRYPTSFLCVPPLAWAAIRFGPAGAALCNLVISVAALWGTTRAYGPFGFHPTDHAVLLLNAFLVVCSATGLLLAAAVAERSAAQRSLAISEERFRLVFERSLAGVFYSTLDGRVRGCNEAFARILGYQSPDEVLAIHANALYPSPSDWDRFLAELTRAGALMGYEVELRKQNGERIWCVENVCLSADPSDRSPLIVGTLVDITARKRAEAALRESEQRFRELAENIREVFWVSNVDQQGVIYISPAYEEVWGRSRESLYARHVSFVEAIHPEDRPRVERALAREKDAGFNEEYRVVRPDGSIRWVHDRGFPVRDETNRVCRMVGIAIDITARKQAEQELRAMREELEQRVEERTAQLLQLNRALRESEQRFSQLADAAFEGIAVHEQGRILAVNRALVEMFGYPADELIGRARLELLAPHFREQARRQITPAPAGGDQPSFETVGSRKDGTTLPIEVRAKAISYEGRAVQVIAVRDVSARKRAEQQLLDHQQQLAHAQRLSSLGEMASGLAHELNQPLGAIANYAHGCLRLLRAVPDDVGRISAVLQEVANQADRAGKIISRMRAFVRKSESQETETNLNEAVRRVVHFLEPEQRNRQVVIQLDLAGDLPVVRADGIQLEQVLVNLLRNAFDALDPVAAGRRRVSIRTAPGDPGEIVVSVADNGVGLTEVSAGRLFEPFFTTKPLGLGLGLSISRSIVEAHGGRMWAARNAGAGATFYFALPHSGNGAGT